MHPGMAAPQRVARDAARITAPLLLHVQRDDEIFPEAGQLELFDRIASRTKYLCLEAGSHTHTPPAAVAGWRTFIAERLKDGSRESWESPPQ
ncbi:hypothetical protein GCM10012284_49340 [Mangrovihabitans endophyticus]|uniref:Uncharacterized protein n=2 Tax=Mangrovihabitans endophyticus TaxID=1751298 RepID=A0A8J3C2F7_9ACTN|nr:hypothetical protein GCM10012284_49340 [Mangrovihabitans endophyticus]